MNENIINSVNIAFLFDSKVCLKCVMFHVPTFCSVLLVIYVNIKTYFHKK